MMGVVEFRMPDIGEGVAEAELIEWLVAVGDTVQVDEPVAEVMTDKATVEIPSPVIGQVSWLGAAPGDRIAIGAALIRFTVEGSGDIDSPPEPTPPISLPEPTPPAVPSENSRPPKQNGLKDSVVIAPAPTRADPLLTRPLASPAVRRRSIEVGVELSLVQGTGPGGRISHSDLDGFINGGSTTATVPAVTRAAVTDIPIIGLRRVIAERMTLAKARIPHITYVEEIDVTEVERLRQSLNGQRSADKPKLTFLPFLIRALTLAIDQYPEFNAHFDDDAGVLHQYGGVHVGIATQTPKGLMVPVLRHAETQDLWRCAQEIKRLSEAANDAKLTRDELSGSTITITSLGALGGIVTAPVINYPEVAIVGVNKMQIRPLWDGTNFIPRNMMNLSSGFDHRIIDGWNAAMFVRRIKQLLEEPATLFIEGA